MVLASRFGSLSQPLGIMLAMPFSLIGALLVLLVVPPAYSLLEGLNARMDGLFRRRPKTSAPALALAGAAAGSGAAAAGVEHRANGQNLTPVAKHTNTTQEDQ